MYIYKVKKKVIPELEQYANILCQSRWSCREHEAAGVLNYVVVRHPTINFSGRYILNHNNNPHCFAIFTEFELDQKTIDTITKDLSLTGFKFMICVGKNKNSIYN